MGTQGFGMRFAEQFQFINLTKCIEEGTGMSES
jgi:hypothetical protein